MSLHLLARFWSLLLASCLALGGALLPFAANASDEPVLVARDYVMAPAAPKAQTQAEADAKSVGCVSCHEHTDQHTMHANPGVVIGCADCHGGDAKSLRAAGSAT